MWRWRGAGERRQSHKRSLPNCFDFLNCTPRVDTTDSLVKMQRSGAPGLAGGEQHSLAVLLGAARDCCLLPLMLTVSTLDAHLLAYHLQREREREKRHDEEIDLIPMRFQSRGCCLLTGSEPASHGRRWWLAVAVAVVGCGPHFRTLTSLEPPAQQQVLASRSFSHPISQTVCVLLALGRRGWDQLKLFHKRTTPTKRHCERAAGSSAVASERERKEWKN